MLDQLVNAARDGISGALVLHGEAGMGKTALLEYIAKSSSDLALVRVSGVEPEQGFAFAALHRLLLPFLGELDELPPPQRAALRVTFGLVEAGPADRFLVGLATLTLLAHVASTRGLLCIVDDAQWVDQESLQVLAFVARRLRAEGVALLFGMRSSPAEEVGFQGIAAYEVLGLPDQAAIELLTASIAGPLDRDVGRRILAETRGCPLALTELAQELTDEQLAGEHRLLEPLPMSNRLDAHFVRQVSALPTHAQMFVLIAAAETSGDVKLVRSVAAKLGCDETAEQVLVRAGLVRVAGSEITFRHPLVRAAVYSGASPSARNQVHSALADGIDATADPDRRARHLIALASGPDERLALELESGAQRARARGGYAAEASLRAEAATFTAEPDLRAARLLDASEAALNAGAAHRAESLLAQASPSLTDPLLRARATRLDGRMRVPLAQPPAAPALLLAAAQQYLPLDTGSARDSLLEAFDAIMVSQSFTPGTTAADIAAVARSTSPVTETPTLRDLLLDGATLLVARGHGAAADTLRSAAAELRNGVVSDEEIARWYMFGLFVANELWDDDTFGTWLNRVELSARARGALIALQVAQIALVSHETRCGRFAAAEARHANTLEITEAMGGPVDFYRPLNVEILAWRGDDAGTRAAADALIQGGTAIGSAPVVYMAHLALAVLHLSAGRYDEALAATQILTSHEALGWTCQALPLVVEAAVRGGDAVAAAAALDEIEKRASASGTPWALGLLARSEALLAEGDKAEALYLAAIEHLDKTSVVTDLARTHLVYGEWLRREQRTVDARQQLRTAHRMFDAMGAAGFAERARVELLATGGRTRRRSVDTTNELTPQELQVAQLAADGDMNQEIATKLFLSTSTVDYHLRKVYRKLDLTSRRQLRDALRE